MHRQFEATSLVLSWSCCRWIAGQVPRPSLASSSSGSHSGLELAGKLFSLLVASCKFSLSIRLIGSDLFYWFLGTKSGFDLNLVLGKLKTWIFYMKRNGWFCCLGWTEGVIKHLLESCYPQGSFHWEAYLRSSWFMSIIRISCSEPRPFLGTWEAWLERDWSGGLWPLNLTGQPSTTIPKNITPFWPKKYRKIIKTDDIPHLPITIANYVKYFTIATVLQEKNQDKQIWPQYGGSRGVLF